MTRVAALLFSLVLLGCALQELPDGRLHVHFLDVGTGDAILIVTPRGRQILVDGGPSPSALASALARHMPFWDRSLDLLVLTHPDADHLTGMLKALESYRVDAWLETTSVRQNPLTERCDKLLQERGVLRLLATAGDQLEIEPGLVIQVLHPPADPSSTAMLTANDNSIVLRVVYGRIAFLLTGDLESQGERILLRSNLPVRAEVLKVAHHGSSFSTTAPFLEAVAPSLAVISVGEANRHGLPAQATLDRLSQAQAITVLRTDQRGTISLSTDGLRLWLRTQH